MDETFRFTIKQLLESMFWFSIGLALLASAGVFDLHPVDADQQSGLWNVIYMAKAFAASAAIGAAFGTLVKYPLYGAILGTFLVPLVGGLIRSIVNELFQS